MNIYKIEDASTGEYYIGMNTTNDENYYGSGVWIKKLAKQISNSNKIPNCAKKNHFKTQQNRFLKTILFETENLNELYDMEKNLIGDLWKTDSKCMNKMCGGYKPPHYKGTEHPKYDSKKLHLVNINDSTEMHITQNDFNKKFASGKDSIRKILNGRQYKGWVLYINRNKIYGKNRTGENSANFDSKEYVFINLISLKTFKGTRTQFKEKYLNMNGKSVDGIINGFNKRYNDWCLFDNIKFVSKISTYVKYKFVKEDLFFVGFRKDFSNLHSIKLGSVNALCNGQTEILKGWKIEKSYNIEERIQFGL